MNKRQNIGYLITILSLFGLILVFSYYGWNSYRQNYGQLIFFSLVSFVPLILFLIPAIKRLAYFYVWLALLAPWWFFVGGILWLWNDYFWGAIIMFLAIFLEVGAILHNFVSKKNRRKNKLKS